MVFQVVILALAIALLNLLISVAKKRVQESSLSRPADLRRIGIAGIPTFPLAPKPPVAEIDLDDV